MKPEENFPRNASISGCGSDSVPPETMELHSGSPCEWPVTRREFVKGAGVAVGATVWGPSLAAQPEPKGQAAKVALSLTINGDKKQVHVDPRTSLLDLLREDLKMTGTKKGCDHGQCGACTVLANGRRINSCLALALSHDGDEITTIEGLAQDGDLHPMQQAFLDCDGYQCGYCTPGQIVSAVGLLDEAKSGAPSMVTVNLTQTGPIELTDPEIRERMSGNLCRCGAYVGIVEAVRQGSTANPAHTSLAIAKIGGIDAAL
jgi:xanthine dehydrogenase YagT iron-sulfur-binding subunit